RGIPLRLRSPQWHRRPGSGAPFTAAHDRTGRAVDEPARWPVRRLMGLHPQLQQIDRELEAARRWARETAAPLPAELWSTRPAAAEGSVAECLIHLNLTSRAFLPLIRGSGSHCTPETRRGETETMLRAVAAHELDPLAAADRLLDRGTDRA